MTPWAFFPKKHCFTKISMTHDCIVYLCSKKKYPLQYKRKKQVLIQLNLCVRKRYMIQTYRACIHKTTFKIVCNTQYYWFLPMLPIFSLVKSNNFNLSFFMNTVPVQHSTWTSCQHAAMRPWGHEALGEWERLQWKHTPGSATATWRAKGVMSRAYTWHGTSSEFSKHLCSRTTANVR